MRAIIDMETGEIVDELKAGDRIRRSTQDEYFCKKTQLIELNKDEDFVKMFTEAIVRLIQEEDLTNTELKLCLFMGKYIGYESGLLRYENNGKLLNLNDIVNITGMSKRSVINGMQGLVSKKVFGVHKTGKENAYTVNPFIFMKGRYVNKTLYNLYKNTKWAKKK